MWGLREHKQSFTGSLYSSPEPQIQGSRYIVLHCPIVEQQVMGVLLPYVTSQVEDAEVTLTALPPLCLTGQCWGKIENFFQLSFNTNNVDTEMFLVNNLYTTL